MKKIILIAYAVSALHVAVLITIGEGYPCLQGPLFAGHVQTGNRIDIPVPHGVLENRPPSFQKLYRHETLALPIQSKIGPRISAELPQFAHRQFLIGHSLRTRFPQTPGSSFEGISWTTRTYQISPWKPVRFVAETDRIHD